MSESEAYDYTTKHIVDRIAKGQKLDITSEQKDEAIRQLAAELQAQRTAYEALNQRYVKAMSDMEIRIAKARGQQGATPRYQDGVRFQPPPNPTLGPDGFPQRGIV